MSHEFGLKGGDTPADLLQRAGHELARASAERIRAKADRDAAASERAEALRFRDEAASLFEVAATDQLTGARTRRFGLAEVSHELERAHRSGTGFVLIFVDVDGLKQVNDVHGHLAGDELLALIGEVVRAHLRPYDLALRYGGDELVCAMPGLTAAAARSRFDHIACVLRIVDPLHSISFGVAEAGPGESLQRLIARADEDLLDARSARSLERLSGVAAAPRREPQGRHAHLPGATLPELQSVTALAR